MRCVTIAYLSIIINGVPTEPFRMEKGLRKETLSSFMFIIVNEALSFIINEGSRLNLIRSPEFRRDKIDVTSLQFADDTLIFMPKEEETLVNLRRILDYFGLSQASRLTTTKHL